MASTSKDTEFAVERVEALAESLVESLAVDANKKVSYGAVEGTGDPTAKAPSVFKVHAALAAGYILFAGGAIVGKFGVHGTSAIIFELFREMASLFSLVIWLMVLKCPMLPSKEDIPRILCGGLAFFFNQIFWFVALKLADPVTGSAWQTFLPILTAMCAVVLGQTTVQGLKALGILISTAGAIFMVVFDSRPSPAVTTHTGLMVRAVSHLMFFLNVAGTSSYFLIMNRFGNKYNPVQTITWSIFVSLTLLFCTTIWMFAWTPLHKVLCHSDVEARQESCMTQGLWLPPMTYFPLFYEVVVCTLMAWPLLNWANQHTDPAVVTVYMGVHPAATTFICMGIVGVMGSAWAHQFHIGMPRLKDLGILLIVGGLLAIYKCEADAAKMKALEQQLPKGVTKTKEVVDPRTRTNTI